MQSEQIHLLVFGSASNLIRNILIRRDDELVVRDDGLHVFDDVGIECHLVGGLEVEHDVELDGLLGLVEVEAVHLVARHDDTADLIVQAGSLVVLDAFGKIRIGAAADWAIELETDVGDITVDGMQQGSRYETRGGQYHLEAETDTGDVEVAFQ